MAKGKDYFFNLIAESTMVSNIVNYDEHLEMWLNQDFPQVPVAKRNRVTGSGAQQNQEGS